MAKKKNTKETTATAVANKQASQPEQELNEYLSQQNEQKTEKVQIDTSPEFVNWLKTHNVSITFSTKSASKIFCVGVTEDDKLSLGERPFDRCGALAENNNSIYLSTSYQIWRLENSIPADQKFQGFDKFYIPQQSFVTGDLNIQDMWVDEQGRILFTNSLFSCLATVSSQSSFIPLWKPSFISQINAENRCHLSGVAVVDNQPKYVTVAGQTDTKQGWVECRQNGGCVIDITTNDVVCSGLSIPQSPRYYQDKLYVLNSGTGHFGSINLESNTFEPIAFMPGYLRGLSFINNYAIVGCCRALTGSDFDGLELIDNLKKNNQEGNCGIYVINLDNGNIEHHLTFDRVINDIFSVVAISDTQRPMALGLNPQEISRMVTIGTPAQPVENANNKER